MVPGANIQVAGTLYFLYASLMPCDVSGKLVHGPLWPRLMEPRAIVCSDKYHDVGSTSRNNGTVASIQRLRCVSSSLSIYTISQITTPTARN